MNMQMKDRLPGSGPVIDADVESIRISFRQQLSPGLFQQVEQRRPLLRRSLEERHYMPPGHDQGMAGIDREIVSQGKSQLVGRIETGCINTAEGAVWTSIKDFFIRHTADSHHDSSTTHPGRKKAAQSELY